MKNPKILIIEDDKFISKAMKNVFEKERFEARHAPSVKQGLELINEWVPDYIILDLILPEKDGFSFLRAIRVNPNLSKIPIIVTSNLPQDPNILPGENTGYVDYIVKSDLDLSQLVKRVKSL